MRHFRGDNAEFVEMAWRRLAGLPEENKETYLEELYRTEWSSKFENLMRNRLVMGGMRYGRMGAKDKPKYDRISSIEKRLKKYQETGNQEFLVDCANLLMLEFVEPNREVHFKSIDDGEHVDTFIY